MSEKWYYVMSGERKGPVAKDEVLSLYREGQLNERDYVWRKGFENWMKIANVEDLEEPQLPSAPEESLELPEPIQKPVQREELDLSNIDSSKKEFFIKTGADRGKQEAEYGPFSLDLLKKLYDENRVNGKTFVFSKQMENWRPLADVKGFEQVFEETPPIIKDEDRRAFKRKPFIARMFIGDDRQVFEGICRDVSVGGMQVLVDNYPIEVGKRVTINAHPENSEYHFTASGEIVRELEGGLGFSFRFINLNEEAVKAINSYTSQE
ncbi:MAG: GYF domain-containing protein [Bacteriovoracaceae bacterium]